MRKLMLLTLTLIVLSTGCTKHLVKTEYIKPQPCKVSVFPPVPTDVEAGICEVNGDELICFLPPEIMKIAVWSEQVIRWREQVSHCPYIKESIANNTEAFNAMASRGHHPGMN